MSDDEIILTILYLGKVAPPEVLLIPERLFAMCAL